MYKCECCDRVLKNKNTREALNTWDWFTGTLGKTVHFCPEHKESLERQRLFIKSREGFPPLKSPAKKRKDRIAEAEGESAKLKRLLARAHRWVKDRDVELADEIKDAL